MFRSVQWSKGIKALLVFALLGVMLTRDAFAASADEKLEKLHPTAPHAHLVFLGVSPAAQGKGVGSAILKATLTPLDAQGVGAVLEATTERNVALYQRHGFDVVHDVRLPQLHLRVMVRPPRG